MRALKGALENFLLFNISCKLLNKEIIFNQKLLEFSKIIKKSQAKKHNFLYCTIYLDHSRFCSPKPP